MDAVTLMFEIYTVWCLVTNPTDELSDGAIVVLTIFVFMNTFRHTLELLLPVLPQPTPLSSGLRASDRIRGPGRSQILGQSTY